MRAARFSRQKMTEHNSAGKRRLGIDIEGLVQGIGFRPYVYRLANELELSGWIGNNRRGVRLEVEGRAERLADFIRRLPAEKPALAEIRTMQTTSLPFRGESGFVIRASRLSGSGRALILPDLATCPACLKEIFDPGDRRYLYPFTNCTDCGPRYSIIESLPYDRRRTSMKAFTMCDRCREEYDNPADRRYHAQPNACPRCGPQVELRDARAKPMAGYETALSEAAGLVREGAIVALKGPGGFQLIADAGNEGSIARLRRRKHRPVKPLAVMLPDLDAVRRECRVSSTEEATLLSPAAPIVLLQRDNFGQSVICRSVAPDNTWLGVMLPCTPLHHILMHFLGIPLVATSGNVSHEPICIDNEEALTRLAGIADFFLMHDRPVVRPVDDSVVRIIAGRALTIRCARGLAPLPVPIDDPGPACLAVGGHLKNTVALALESTALLSQHHGDLDRSLTRDVFGQTIRSLSDMYDFKATVTVSDEHPDYGSTRYAVSRGGRLIRVQHHYAHILSGLADNGLDGPLLGVVWDGSGLGPDGTLWGGEFLRADRKGYIRLARFRRFMLPGGEKAMREPRRAALGVLYEIFGDDLFARSDLISPRAFSAGERNILRTILDRSLNAPRTSSAGRLFDVVASLTGECQVGHFEGQAAMRLESLAEGRDTEVSYPFRTIKDNGLVTVDWEPLILDILHDIAHGVEAGQIASRFHNSLAEIIVAVAELSGESEVLLTGGCFQNKVLTERSLARLKSRGFAVYRHGRVPCNDGGLALGQILAVKAQVKKDPEDVSGHTG